MIKDLSALVVPLVQGPSGRAKIFVPVAGGGKTKVRKNVACMYMWNRHQNNHSKV
jgi:hypothetical protein